MENLMQSRTSTRVNTMSMPVPQWNRLALPRGVVYCEKNTVPYTSDTVDLWYPRSHYTRIINYTDASSLISDLSIDVHPGFYTHVQWEEHLQAEAAMQATRQFEYALQEWRSKTKKQSPVKRIVHRIHRVFRRTNQPTISAVGELDSDEM